MTCHQIPTGQMPLRAPDLFALASFSTTNPYRRQPVCGRGCARPRTLWVRGYAPLRGA